jgi:calcium-binding protein CML
MSLLAPLVFTAEDEQRLRKLFDYLDHDHKGYIVPDNLRELCHDLGHELPAEKAQELILRCDPEKVGRITWEPFVKAMSVALPKIIAAVILIGAFRMLDKEKTGFIARADLERLVTDAGVKIEKARLDELILKTNPGTDGRIEFKLFVSALTAYLRSV